MPSEYAEGSEYQINWNYGAGPHISIMQIIQLDSANTYSYSYQGKEGIDSS